MSGGSFNYVGLAEGIADLVAKPEDTERMIAELRAVGATDVADRIASIVEQVAMLNDEVAATQPVMRAMEWWYSGDTGEADFFEALTRYRGAPPGRVEPKKPSVGEVR